VGFLRFSAFFVGPVGKPGGGVLRVPEITLWLSFHTILTPKKLRLPGLIFMILKRRTKN
jgi:hypothetical protein